MNNFRKSRGLGFHLRRFLCIVLSLCMVLMGLPVKSQAESVINIKVDALRELKTITSTIEKVTDILLKFRIITPDMREKIQAFPPIVDTLQELKAILLTLEKIMSLLEEFKDISSALERIMYALEELKTITPTLERGMGILNNLKTASPTRLISLEKVMDTLKELKAITPTLEKIMNNLEELKANRGAVTPDLESKIRGNLAELRTITPPLDRKIWNNLAQISPEIAPAPSPAPVTLEPAPAPAPVGDSGMGVGGTILLVGGVVGAVAIIAAAAGVGKKEDTTYSGGGGGGGGGGGSGYGDCGNGRCCPSGYPLWCNGSCYKVAGSSPCGISGEIICYKKVKGIGKIPANLNYNALKLPGYGLTLFNSNLSSGVDLFKTKFEILGACSGDDSILNTTLGLQVKGEYSRQRGQFVFSPFIQLQHQRSGGLAEFASNDVYTYTTTLYGMDILYVPYNLTLSSMIRQAIQSEDSESLNAAVVQLTLKF